MASTPVLIYDGDCGFCTSSAAWIRARWREQCTAASWQELGDAGLAALGLNATDVSAAAWFIDGDRTLRGERAVAAALKLSRQPWRGLGLLIDAVPIRWIAALGYRLVARYRYLLPGSTDACRLP